jgi:hypothetical protein
MMNAERRAAAHWIGRDGDLSLGTFAAILEPFDLDEGIVTAAWLYRYHRDAVFNALRCLPDHLQEHRELDKI